ncbi:leucine-rich repeat domain-containing protein [Candidatus Poribacteria bacterium]|nr:leucine-rich repeat domain-containing protein [Candidatus Poribacteria bacterium]
MLFVLICFLIPLTATAQIVSIPDANLRASINNVLGKPPGTTITTMEMATLTELTAPNANIVNLTGLEAATNLIRLDLGTEYVAAEGRLINNNSISDLSPLAGLISLTRLHLEGNNISDISALAGLTNLVVLGLWNNSISDISALSGLTNLFFVGLWDNLIYDVSPLVANRGFGQGEEVNLSENPLSEVSINTHIPALQSRGVEVHFSNLKPPLAEYRLSIPAGLSLIHIPLDVTTVNGMTQPIESIGDLYDALGGSTVNFIVTYDPAAQEWFGYFGAADRGTRADRALTGDMGILVGMFTPVSILLSGNPLVANRRSSITFYLDLNLVGLPLRDKRINRVSDLFTLNGIGGNVVAIILTNGGEFKLVGRAGDPGDIPVIEGQGFIVIVQQAATVSISGDG